MSKFGSFIKALGQDAVNVWHAIEGSPAVEQIEKLAVDAIASELEMAAAKILGSGTLLDDEANALIKQLAVKLDSLLPVQPPAKG